MAKKKQPKKGAPKQAKGELAEREVERAAGGIGSATSGAGAGKIKFNSPIDPS